MKRLSKLLFLAVALSLSWTMTKAQSSTITDDVVTLTFHSDDIYSDGTLLYAIGDEENHEVTVIGEVDRHSLVEADIPGSVMIDGIVYKVLSIGDKAFNTCYKMTSITLPNTIINIGERAFERCNVLKNIIIPNSVTNIGNFAFNNCYSLESARIGNSVKTIGRDAFCQCSSLKNLVIPSSVEEIQYYGFYGCSSLVDVKIKNATFYLDDYMFADCSSLTSVTIPATITGIGAAAFWSCGALKDVTVLHTDPTAFNCYKSAFKEVPLSSATLHVPSGCADAYRACEPWSHFAIILDDADNLSNADLALGTNVIMMTKGDAVELTYSSETVEASQIIWTSDDKSIATVNSSGVISAVGDGLCKITASYDGKIQDKCTVFVGNVNESSDGHEYVDLGLPSGTQWAATNIGAETPEEYGDYFQWGDTIAKDDNVYSWTTYKFCNNSASALNKYCTDAAKWAGENNPDKLKELEVGDDVAYSQWGMAWRVPSLDQFKELINSNYTICERSMYNGVEGFLLTSRTNGKCIFLPAASHYDNGGLIEERTKGYYWSRTLSDNDNLAYELFLENSTALCNNMTSRSNGLPVRPVYQGIRDNANLSVSATQLDFGNVATGSSRSVKFNIVNNTYDNVEISPLSLQNKDFSIDWSGGNISPNSSQEVTVTYTPTLSSSSTGEALTVRTSSDSTIVNVVASSHTGSNELTTKENLVVWLKDGSKTTFVLNEKPIVTIGDKTLKVNGAKASAEYDFKDILRLTYDGMFPDDITKEISATEAETKKTFTQTSEALVFSSDKEILDVKIVAVSGAVVKRFTVQDGSAVTLSLSQIPTGVYVINVNNISYKVSIR